jgi:hypothetical protein
VGALQIAVSGVVTLVVYSILLFAVYKIFQISTELSEIKDLLKDIKINTVDASPAMLSRAQSPESLLRAVNATSYASVDKPPVPGCINIDEP